MTRARVNGALFRPMLRALGAVPDALSIRRLYRDDGGGRSIHEATRSLRRRPGFGLAVVLTLALGMGSAVAIFTVVDGLMLRPIPFRDPAKLFAVASSEGGTSVDVEAVREWKAQSSLFEDARAYAPRNVALTGASEPGEYLAWMVEPGFLRMLGLSPALGRDFTADEVQPGNGRVVLLSDEVWRAAFGGDRGVLGRSVELDTVAYTIVGVLPPALRMLPGGLVRLLVPLSDPPPYPQLNLLVRLSPELTPASVQARLDQVSAVLTRDRPREQGWRVRVIPVARGLGAPTRTGLRLLAGGVLFLLLIACTNAAGLLFVQGVARQNEFAVRAALGASRRVLFRQALAESLILALLSGLAGLLLAWWGVRALLALAPRTLLQFNYTTVGIDARVVAFALLLTVFTGLLFGLAPAWRAARPSARTGRGLTLSRAQVRTRRLVQVLQLTLTVMLLAGAGLLGKSFLRLHAVDPGYEPERLLNLTLSRRLRADTFATNAFHRDLGDRLRALPGVAGVARSTGFGIRFGYTIEPEDANPFTPPSTELLPNATVDTAWFRVMGIPIVDGRGFNAEDLTPNSGSVVINEALASTLWPGERAVGRRFRVRNNALLAAANPAPSWSVVGVAANARLDGPHEPYGRYRMFYPAARIRGGTLTLRAIGDPAALAPAVRDVLRQIDPDQPIRTLQTGRDALGETISQPRFMLVIMLVFATVAVALAGVGMYSLIAYLVSQRVREIGLRMAVGARSADVAAEVVGSGLALALAGAALGLAGALAVSRFFTTLLFDVSPLDLPALAFAVLALLACCTAALAIPARRAARTDPASALRAD
jgi:predicted permease